jgi:hypothetical protein
MNEQEKYYDEVIAPKLLEISQDALKHGLNNLFLVEYSKNMVGATISFNGDQCLRLLMARWAIECHGNVDSFWMAIQRHATKHGHSSIFLQQQGIPLQPEGNSNEENNNS